MHGQALQSRMDIITFAIQLQTSFVYNAYFSDRDFQWEINLNIELNLTLEQFQKFPYRKSQGARFYFGKTSSKYCSKEKY